MSNEINCSWKDNILNVVKSVKIHLFLQSDQKWTFSVNIHLQSSVPRLWCALTIKFIEITLAATSYSRRWTLEFKKIYIFCYLNIFLILILDFSKFEKVPNKWMCLSIQKLELLQMFHHKAKELKILLKSPNHFFEQLLHLNFKDIFKINKNFKMDQWT